MNSKLALKQALLAAIFGLCIVSTNAAAAELMTKQYGSCLDRAGGVTAAMHECIGSETKVQDVKLNANYKALVSKLSTERKNELLEAQRAWIKFRDANCKFYADPDGGSMAGILASDCYLQATAERAKELESLAR